jgi:hypothetical protein
MDEEIEREEHIAHSDALLINTNEYIIRVLGAAAGVGRIIMMLYGMLYNI